MEIDPEIRLLTDAQLDDAFALSTTAGWNQRIDDWRMLLAIAPAGSFAAVSDGRVIGTAMGIDYGSFGWIAMMLVDPAYRGRGLGARLLEAAMGVLPLANPIRLDATPLGRPLYHRYGFEDETTLSRRVACLADDPPEAIAESDVRPLTAADLPVVREHDSQVFGGDRRLVLEWALRGAPHYAFIGRKPSVPPQYCFGRSGRLFDHIGPVVAGDPDTARTLVAAAVRAARGNRVVIDAFDSRETFGAWLGSSGFEAERPLFRMCRPAARSWPQTTDGSTLREFAILGPEFG